MHCRTPQGLCSNKPEFFIDAFAGSRQCLVLFVDLRCDNFDAFKPEFPAEFLCCGKQLRGDAHSPELRINVYLYYLESFFSGRSSTYLHPMRQAIGFGMWVINPATSDPAKAMCIMVPYCLVISVMKLRRSSVPISPNAQCFEGAGDGSPSPAMSLSVTAITLIVPSRSWLSLGCTKNSRNVWFGNFLQPCTCQSFFKIWPFVERSKQLTSIEKYWLRAI